MPMFDSSDDEKTPLPEAPTPATPVDGRKTVEAWAELKIPAHLAPWQAEQSAKTDKLPWHRNMWREAAKAVRGWPAEKLVTEAEFDEALKDAQQIKIG